MEKNDKETRDFMSVESFSQLPFTRPKLLKEKGIRLFGKEFGGDPDLDSVETNAEKVIKESENGESGRKFECHYCFRNFPTSQALGGHQNAHKRERQNAKRAAMGYDIYPQTHSFGINYHRFASGSDNSQVSTYNQYPWNSNSSVYNRFYGSYGAYNHAQTPPIHGSPLSLWRNPSTNNVPRLNNHDQYLTTNSSLLYSNIDRLQPSRNESSSSQNRYVYQSSKMKDHVSLDLHL
ncbi:hypothetical protein DCAR_0626642 [Daucus carota subsp. sativus]|uniref:Uncharacterized protein n=1 Tax=Daucus carota subsp. sativus TaxID=79200 RepID=A0A164X6M9_DAUCS|nr:PREDICTED: zinc finger protein GIS-like [Daucus carota subsp. sativus]WOH07213.1 hypothetical protein DCAR_0626642 [Daucus carota subsp. sativus]